LFLYKSIYYINFLVVADVFVKLVVCVCFFLIHNIAPHYNYAIDNIEAVQRKFTRRLKGCEDMVYPARLNYLHLQSLERRRLTADLILTYRIIFGLLDVCLSDYFQLVSSYGNRSITRGNPFKSSVNYCRTNKRKNVFSERVVKVWNSLPRVLLILVLSLHLEIP